jgi:hypothetical protein
MGQRHKKYWKRYGQCQDKSFYVGWNFYIIALLLSFNLMLFPLIKYGREQNGNNGRKTKSAKY